MASPDLSTLTSSAQIFSSNRTIPQIRAVHKQLHAEADDRAARLRTQVGASYRDLLGTADAIVTMRTNMATVQETLGRAGGRCGRAVISGKVEALGGFVDSCAGAGDSLGAVARARLLSACALALERVLRSGAVADGQGQEGCSRGDRLVVAAKVYVLGRLLMKSFGESAADKNVRPAVEAANKNLGRLRGKLLRRIERVLQAVGEHTNRGNVLKALSAYSLATSSGARDVLRYFLRMRGEAMTLTFDVEENERSRSPKDVLRCLGLFTKTLLDVQALVPAKLTEALGSLKKGALLADGSLRAIEGLRLDIHERWCGDEIQYFTPFIRHDDLDGKQSRDMLTGWAKQGSDVLLQGLEQTLASMTEFKLIVEMRTSVLKLWISDGGKAKGFDPSILLDQIREAINKHMLRVLDTKVNKLRLVGSEVSATLEAWQEGTTDKHQGLWDEGSFDMDLSNGAAHFTQEVISRLYGRNDAVSKAVSSYNSWYQVIDDVGQVVEQLRGQRWDNDVEEIEDEETIDHRQQLLSKDDPQALHDHLNSSLIRAFKSLDEQVAALWDGQSDNPNRGEVAMYLLRILRDLRSKLPNLEEARRFGLAVVPALQEVVASAVAVSPLDDFATTALTRKLVAGRSLWEGEPELPASPSPGAFRFLRDISLSMSDAGMDLWSPAAVGVLKQHLRKQLCELWLAAMASRPAELKQRGDEAKAGAEGDPVETDHTGVSDKSVTEETESTQEQQTDLFIQWLFDISYLRSCLSLQSSAIGDELKDLEETVFSRTGLEGTAARRQLSKASQEYWKRTSLLFGLLT